MTRTIFFLIIAILLSSFVYATGVYHIGKDGGGVFMDTDQNGSWYIDPSHLRDFSLGETGSYSVRADRRGTFIITAKGKKYYIDRSAQEKWEQEVASFNEQQRLKSGIETKVDLLDGSHVLVPVTIGTGRNEMEVTMLLDTGASITVLHRDVVDQMRLESTGKARLMIAGGQVIDSDIVTLDVVGVGPIRKKGLDASVINHSGPRPPYQGLLGMNFLMGLKYQIDYQRGVIVWEP